MRKMSIIEKITSGALALALLGSVALCGCTNGAGQSAGGRQNNSEGQPELVTEVQHLAYAVRPETPPDREQRMMDSEGNSEAVKAFSENLLPALMVSDNQNKVVSPINIYLAFAMLSETTDGKTRQQILDALGCSDIDDLRVKAEALLRANDFYYDSFASQIANSLWLRDDDRVSYVQDTLDYIAQNYRADSFSGPMGTPEMNKALQTWLNDNTGGLLTEQASGIKTNTDTMLALASTIYFKASWVDKFGDAVPGTFYGIDGEIPCDMMTRGDCWRYYMGEKFDAASVGIESGYSMWVLLPKEGILPEELITDEEAMRVIYYDKYDDERRKVILTMPRFDINSDLDIIGGMEKMGITDVLNPKKSDFTPLTSDKKAQIYISQAQHAARVITDEYGVLAAAYTILDLRDSAGAPPRNETLIIIADRPFLFAIKGADHSLLFIGTVYSPEG